MNREDLVKVNTRQDGFRRAGVAWHGESIVPLAEFTDAQWEAIKAEPVLVVSEVSADEFDGWLEQNGQSTEPATDEEVDDVTAARPDDLAEAERQIAAAIQGLDREDKTKWTKGIKGWGSKPDARVLTEILGWEVSAKERDKVWDNIKDDI